MTTIAQQIEILQARFAAPSSVKFQSHYVQVTGSEEPSTIAPCCQAARSVLRSSVVACAAKNGVPGVIEYFTNRFSWGCYPCQYYCECFRHADELFCTGTMCVGLEALDIARAHCTAPVPFDLVTVELIIVQSRDVINSSKVDVADSQRTHPNKFISGDWLLADTMYHNVVGLVDRNLQLTICDYDAQFIFHHDKNLSEERVAAIRVCAWTGGDTKDSFLSAKDVKSAARRLSWSGMTIPLGKWFSIPAGAHLDSTHCSAADPLNVLGAVYGAKQHPESLVSRAGTAAQSSVAKRKVPDADTTAGLVTVSLDSVESHISTDSLESLLPPATLAYPHTSMHPPEVKQSPSIDAEHSKSAGSAGRLPTVLISGIYMGPNPCPGMGVARALRACYGDRVNLIALDDAKFSDPVFDSLQQVFEMGSTLCGATASKQRQWDTVARLLLEHLRDSDGNTAPFYIPGRDRDIDVAALGKSAIEAHLQQHNSTNAVNAASLESAAGWNHDTSESLTLGVLTGDGGGCIHVVPPSDCELTALRGALLCPYAAVVALTAKPDIVAATMGPLGKFFKVPEYARLSAAGGTQRKDGTKLASVKLVDGFADATRNCIETFTSTASLTTPVESTGQSRADGNMPLLEMRAFAERIGYPVLVKGPNQGAALCSSWFQLRHLITTAKWVQNGGFIQRHTTGWEKCLAFAAFEGRLSGCVMMTKASYTDSGKVWSGDLEPVPAELCTALVEFVRLTCWTGGGEIEFIEEVVPGIDISFDTSTHTDVQSSSGLFLPRSSVPLSRFSAGDVPLRKHEHSDPRSDHYPTRWVVDFNPRFPAWIFASAYSGCNLPALLLQDAMSAAEAKQDSNRSLLHVCSAMSLTSVSANSSTDVSQATDSNNAVRASFVRSVIEIPVVHTLHQRHLPLQPITAQQSKMKASANKEMGREYKYDVLPPAVADTLLSHGDGNDSLGDLTTVVQDLHCLTTAVETLLLTNRVELTPKYVLNVATLEHTLHRLYAAIKAARATALTNIEESTGVLSASAIILQDQLQVQMCLSVKTQPNTLLLQAAEHAGYLAECIDLAEVYSSVLDGGFPWHRVVLTGPGKWWDCKTSAERAVELQWLQTHGDHSVGDRKFHAIFADSLADLKEIVHRLLDPSDWLDTDVMGIRWVPLWGPSSRFGLNCKDVQIVRQAAEVVGQLPSRYRLGMHFHHACSALGAEQWFSLAKGFSVFCREFAVLCGRSVATVDFGGGFEPHFLESAHAQRQLRSLFKCVYHTCVLNKDADHNPVSVQFELGKSVSEQAGGVLTRILSIRERGDRRSQRNDDDHDDKAEGPPSTPDGQSQAHASASFAVIVDTTVADISTPNSHAVFWVQALPEPVDGPTTLSSEGHTKYKCTPLTAGHTEIWGRTCMEWDKIPGFFALPAEARAGDLLLISGCGAYDMSMQYAFGDGVGRTQNVIVL